MVSNNDGDGIPSKYTKAPTYPCKEAFLALVAHLKVNCHAMKEDPYSKIFIYF